MTLMGPSLLMSTGYILMDEGQLQHARLAVKTDPNSDQAIMELLEVQAAGHPHRRLHGKQPPDPTLPHVPPPKQHPDGDFLSLAAHGSEGEEPGGAEAEIEDHQGEPPQLEEGEDGPQWPQGIFSDGEEEPVPALHTMRAGGENTNLSSTKTLKTSGSAVFGTSGLHQCRGCGLQQPDEKACGFCGQASKLDRQRVCASRALCSLQYGDQLSQRLREEHWGWKNQLMEELRSVAVGEDEGGLHGYTLEFLESQITTLEDELVELDRSENVARLKSLVANSQQGGQDQPNGPPATVLQTYTVPLQQVRKELDLWKQPLLAEYKSLLDTGAIQVTNEEEVKRHPNYANLERAPAMLVPTIKAPSGRRKARIVICGNRIEKADGGQQSVEVEKSSPFSTYAGGADGTLLRCLTRKAAAEDWTVASLDVATAFLLAPRRAASQCLLIMKPPRILVEAGICDEGDLWRIENALYGLQSSPADWSSYRNNVLGKLRWMFGTEEFHLVRTSEQNLWKILPTKEPINKEDVAQGYVALYVDDVMAVGKQRLGRQLSGEDSGGLEMLQAGVCLHGCLDEVLWI